MAERSLTENECVFCRLARGEQHQPIVYSDEQTIAVVDLRQVGGGGHVLVMPRRHVRNIFDLDDETGAAVMRTVVRVSRAVRDALNAEGISHWISNEKAGGQEVFHLHVHVMARFQGDGLLRIYPGAPAMPDLDELEGQAALIRAELSSPAER